MTPRPTLYGFPGSLCSQKVRLALAEKGVSYESRFIDIELRMQNYEPWYLRLNPRGVVPTLVHEERVVTDSADIIRYVDRAFDGPPLTPNDPHERELMEQWVVAQDRLQMRELSYASFRGVLGLFMRKVTMPLRLRNLRRSRDENPDLADLYSAKIEDVQQWRATTTSTAEIAEIRRQLEAVLLRAEEQLGKTRYLAGGAYSLADVAWTCVLARLAMLGLASSLWGENRLPALAAYYEGLRQRASFVEADIWDAPPSTKARRALLKSALDQRRSEKERARQHP